MGRELSEDRFHKLERQLALAKGFAEDMQAAFQECEDHATALDEEAEKIQEEVKLRIALLQWLTADGHYTKATSNCMWLASIQHICCQSKCVPVVTAMSVLMPPGCAMGSDCLQNFKLRRTVQEMESRAQRLPQFGMKAGLRDGNRPFIPYSNRPPFHSPPVQRPYTRRPVDSAIPPNKRGMAPDRRDEGDRSYRQRVR